MTRKKMTVAARRVNRTAVVLEIELPALSDEAAAAVADVLVQLYHRFEAAYYVQILSHHAQQVCPMNGADAANGQLPREAQLF